MVKWNQVKLWTKRIFFIVSLILIAIAFFGYYPRISQVNIYPDYTNLIFFIVFLVIGLIFPIFFISDYIIQRYKLQKAISDALYKSIRINDKELASKINEPLWRVTPIFKKMAYKDGILVYFSGAPTFFHSNFIDRFIKTYENYGDLGNVSKEFAQKHSINISKDDLDIILDELIYLGYKNVVELAEKWEKEKPTGIDKSKKPSKAVIRRLGDSRRKKKK
ncbi:MAG: hypothetical protein HWN67_08425 [Candidatus Helarchaeota archaeon]|nr:hypothetical protein [Candidatus Helarchaeota archaeon]